MLISTDEFTRWRIKSKYADILHSCGQSKTFLQYFNLLLSWRSAGEYFCLGNFCPSSGHGQSWIWCSPSPDRLLNPCVLGALPSFAAWLLWPGSYTYLGLVLWSHTLYLFAGTALLFCVQNFTHVWGTNALMFLGELRFVLHDQFHLRPELTPHSIAWNNWPCIVICCINLNTLL